MKALGRFTAVIAVPGTALLFLLLFLWPELGRSADGAIRVIDWFGVAVALSMFLTWLLAIWHWGTRFPSGPPKGSWGLVIVFGFVLGAAAYWAVGARHVDGASDQASLDVA